MHRLTGAVGILVLAVAAAACSGQQPTSNPPAPSLSPTPTLRPSPNLPPTPTPQATPSATEAGTLPTPVAAWSLRGNGDPTAGDIGLEFEGGYTSTADGTAFDGLTGRAVSQVSSPLDATQSVTLSAWVSHPTQLVDVPYAISLTGEGELRMALGIAGVWTFGTSAADAEGPAPVRSNDWVHLAGVSDREAGAVRIYLDGELVGEKPASAPLAAAGPLIIGGAWAGAVADVSFYQAALTSDQIAEIYSTTAPQSSAPEWSPDPATYADGVLNGTWDYVLREGVDEAVLAQQKIDFEQTLDRPAIRLGFDGPLWWEGVAVDGRLVETDGETVGDIGLIHVDGDRFTISSWNWKTTYEWALDGDELSLTFVKECKAQEGTCYDRDQVAEVDPLVVPVVEHTYTRSGDDASY